MSHTKNVYIVTYHVLNDNKCFLDKNTNFGKNVVVIFIQEGLKEQSTFKILLIVVKIECSISDNCDYIFTFITGIYHLRFRFKFFFI